MRERPDHQVICDMVEPNANILDLGCGDGTLMSMLAREKGARVQGIELNDQAVHLCVEKGLSVMQGDIESGLADYPEQCFTHVIMNQCMQEVKKVDFVIQEGLRVAGRVIVGFPNFAHLVSRSSLFFLGRTPVTPSLPYHWHETPNLRFLSIRDFKDFCASKNLRVAESVCLGARGPVTLLPNLFARSAVFILEKSTGEKL